jgi:branched-chain amino acid transport system permease protein
MLDLLLQAIINGVLIGGVYASLSIGLALVWGVMDIVNFAHAGFMILAAFLYYFMLQLFGVDPFLSLILIFPIFFLVGASVYKLLITRLRRPELMSLIVTFGVLVILEGSMSSLWGNEPKALATAYSVFSINVGGLVVRSSYLLGFLLSLVMMLMLNFLLKSTLIGKKIRATAQSREAAVIMGIDTATVTLITFSLGLATAAVAAVPIALSFAFYPGAYLYWTLMMFLIVALGGLGSVFGTFFGSLAIGLIQSISTVLLPVEWADVIAFTLLVVVLLIKPRGLFGKL